MPTLIRLVIALLFLAGLVLGSMVALTVLVQPKDKEVTRSVPAKTLFGN